MNEKRKCLVGHDDDNMFGELVLAIWMTAIICMIVVGMGVFIGGFHSIKNYILAFKHNVVDSNRKPLPAE